MKSKLEEQNIIYSEILKQMEKAIYSVEVTSTEYKSDEFLRKLKKDLEIILNLYNDKLNTANHYIQMRKQNTKLFNKVKELEDAIKKLSSG